MKKLPQDPQMNLSQAGEVEQGRRPSGPSPLNFSPDSIIGNVQNVQVVANGPVIASPKSRVGRPLKYRHLLDILEDDTLYSPGSIVRNGEQKGLLPSVRSVVERNLRRLRIRHTFARFVVNHKFPQPGEGLVKLVGQAPVPGWFGATWKAALPQ